MKHDTENRLEMSGFTQQACHREGAEARSKTTIKIKSSPHFGNSGKTSALAQVKQAMHLFPFCCLMPRKLGFQGEWH